MPERYIYAVTRIHTNEKNLLNQTEMDSLASVGNLSEALNLLSSKGWDTSAVSGDDLEAMVALEYKKTWALITEAAGQIDELDILRRTRDFHNLKAAIKLVYAGEPGLSRPRYYLDYGLISVDRIVKAAETCNFSILPEYLAETGIRAWNVLKDTGNGQLCEIVIDRAALETLDAEGKALKSCLLRQYAVFTVDTANIKAAIRCHALGKGREFLEKVIANGGSLNREGLINAALGAEPEIGIFLRKTQYAGAASDNSSRAFERWRSDELIRMIRPQAKVIYGIEPLVAHILARENEISIVRLILSSIGLGESAVKGRLGLTYV